MLGKGCCGKLESLGSLSPGIKSICIEEHNEDKKTSIVFISFSSLSILLSELPRIINLIRFSDKYVSPCNLRIKFLNKDILLILLFNSLIYNPDTNKINLSSLLIQFGISNLGI